MIKPGDEIDLPPEYDKESLYDKLSKINAKQKILRFNFDCSVCGMRFYDYRDVMAHMKGSHGDIMKRYESISKYKEAVKRGDEPDIKRHWKEWLKDE